MDRNAAPSRTQQPIEELNDGEVLSYLVTKPLTALLYQRVRGFLGNSLQVFRCKSEDESSGVSYGLAPKPAQILLCLSTDSRNIAADIAHEILHIKTAIDGFPVRIATELSPVHPGILKNIIRIHNSLGHLIFHDAFVSLGFRSLEFVSDVDRNADPIECARAATEHLRLGKPFVRGAWLTCYLAELVSRSFGWKNTADEIRKAGRRLFPERMDADAEWLNLWLTRGEFRTPYRYPFAVTELLNRFEFPQTKMERLHRSKEGLEFSE